MDIPSGYSILAAAVAGLLGGGALSKSLFSSKDTRIEIDQRRKDEEDNATIDFREQLRKEVDSLRTELRTLRAEQRTAEEKCEADIGKLRTALRESEERYYQLQRKHREDLEAAEGRYRAEVLAMQKQYREESSEREKELRLLRGLITAAAQAVADKLPPRPVDA